MDGRSLLACWDTARSHWTVGKGLIFLEEMAVLCRRHEVERAIVGWCGESPAPSLVRFAAHVATVQEFPDAAAAADWRATQGADVAATWGLEPVDQPTAYDESLLFLQSAAADGLPPLQPRVEWRTAAQEWLTRTWPGRRTIALHLKQVPGGQSNAQLTAWQALLTWAAQHAPELGFVAVGRDDVEPLRACPNLVWTGGAALELDLALIATCEAFMGMSSGLCQMALFGPKPYAIFKHPGHHTEAMTRELCGPHGFGFAGPHQHFLIADDTPARLQAECARLLGIVAAEAA